MKKRKKLESSFLEKATERLSNNSQEDFFLEENEYLCGGPFDYYGGILFNYYLHSWPNRAAPTCFAAAWAKGQSTC